MCNALLCSPAVTLLRIIALVWWLLLHCVCLLWFPQALRSCASTSTDQWWVLTSVPYPMWPGQCLRDYGMLVLYFCSWRNGTSTVLFEVTLYEVEKFDYMNPYWLVVWSCFSWTEHGISTVPFLLFSVCVSLCLCASAVHVFVCVCIFPQAMSFEAHSLTVPSVMWLGLLPSDLQRFGHTTRYFLFPLPSSNWDYILGILDCLFWFLLLLPSLFFFFQIGRASCRERV